MSQFPQQIDDDSTIPAISDNLTELGGDAINSLRDAVFNIETALGLNIAGSASSLSSRLGVFINPDGSPNTSVLFSLGLVTLPITNDQIINNAGIPESKLSLDYSTQNLFNYIRDLSRDVNKALGWINISGIKLEPHLAGFLYRHNLIQIDVAPTSAQFLNNVFRVLRDNTNAYTLINDINSELLHHQWADGSPFGVVKNITTNNGSIYPSSYAHVASGIFLNTSRFSVIPQTAQDVQTFADFIDNSSILTLGTRIQNLYHNGISRNSRSSSLTIDGYGQPLVPVTPTIAYLRGVGSNSFPTDDIAIGDDIIQFMPSATAQNNNTFDEQFALVRVGDIIRVNYAGDGYNVELPFVISEKKYIQGGGNKIYIIRIAGKNIAYSPNSTARIDRDLFNNNKFGVLTSAMGIPLNSTGSSLLGSSISPSLIVGAPRGAQALGIGFSADQFNEKHYLLYLALYTTGNPLDGYTFLPGIDVTGNLGTTPGSYTLDSVVAATNNAFRQPGLNYRFIAFQYQGEFGIMLADSYNNVSFSIVSGVVSGSGVFDQAATQLKFPNNVVDVFPITGSVAPDPLGFGPFGAGIASPPFLTSYGSPAAANFPTIIFPPLRRNNYYINGNERERLALDVGQALDVYGDGYWVATIDGYSNNAGPPGHTTVTYNIPLDLSTSGLKAGKTLVVQPMGTNLGLVNYGRFVIQSIAFTCCPPIHTQITVFDAVHAVGASPASIASVGSSVLIYFNSDSVSFDNETATDFSVASAPFKRFFEVYADSSGNTFTHERGRISISGSTTINGVPLYNSFASLGQMDIVDISSKLRGYQFGTVNKINLKISSFNAVTGVYIGNLSSFDGINFTRPGPVTSGKIGEITRFYDETNLDYIDIVFNIANTISTFTNRYIDFQLFPTLSLDEEIMLIGTCQVNNSTGQISQIKDRRQFGNTSEEELTTSALDFISLPDKLLHFNGVIRGFDGYAPSQYGTAGLFSLTGGLALVNGNLTALNDQTFTVPALLESYNLAFYPINYALCVNSTGDLVTIALTDFDAILGTPNNATGRIVTVNNVVSSTTYQIDSNTFSYILNNRKDLTVLYIISAIVAGTGSGATTTLSVRDVRRFINDADSSIPAVLTSDNSQGNFKTINASLNWLKFNSSFQNTLDIKGSFILNFDPGLNFPLEIVGNGSNASLEFTSAMNISNVTFRNMTIIFDTFLTATNVTFQDCTITFGAASTLTNVVIDPSNVTVNDTLTVSQLSVLNSTINVPVFIGFNLGNNVSFQNCIFNYTAPFSGSHAIRYDTTNLVNANSGMIYAFVGATLLTGLTVSGCVFNNTLADHYPFISLQLTDYSAIVQNINISNNQFISQTTLDDKRAVIAFTSILSAPASSGTFPKFPRMVNAVIDHNICNQDQMILISIDSNSRSTLIPIVGAMIDAVNCKISNNVCGTIGYLTSGGSPSHADNAAINLVGVLGVRDKTSGLTIQNNSCKLIANLSGVGAYVPFRAIAFPSIGNINTEYMQTGTGACAILNNTANWIQVGCVTYNTLNSHGLIISGNTVSPNDPTFLANFTDNVISHVPLANVGILLRRGQIFGVIETIQSTISNNNIVQTTFFETNGTATAPFYYDAAIVCFHNADIVNNVVNGVINSSAAPILYLWGENFGQGPTLLVNGNTFIRNGLNIQAYVVGQPITGPQVNSVSIVGNIFDSPFIDTGNTIQLSGLNIPSLWSFYGNINQTVMVAISPTDFARYAIGSAGDFPGNTNSSGAYPTQNIFHYTDDVNETFSVDRFIPFNSFSGVVSTPDSQYLVISDANIVPGTTREPVERNFSFTLPLDYILPSRVKIIAATMGVWLREQGNTLDTTASVNNQATLTLLTFNPTATSNSVNGVADVKSNLEFDFFGQHDLSINFAGFLQSSFFVGVGAGSVSEAALLSSTQYLSITSAQTNPVQNLYVTNSGSRIAATFDLNYKRGSNAPGFINWYLSPIVITYRW